MNTQMNPVRPAMPAAPASRPQAAAAPVMFGGKPSVKFGSGEGRPNVLVRFVKWLGNMLGLGMDKLEKATPEAALNNAHNELVQRARNAENLFSRVIGQARVQERVLAERKEAHQKEQLEAESALAALEAAKEQNMDAETVAALETRALKELDEAEQHLKQVTEQEEVVQRLKVEAERAQADIEQVNTDLAAAVKRLEQGKQDAAQAAVYKQLVETKRMMEEARGQRVGFTNSVGTMLNDLAVEKEAYKAQLNGGKTDAQIAAELKADKLIKQNNNKARLDAILAARKKDRQQEGTQQSSGSDDVKPGS